MTKQSVQMKPKYLLLALVCTFSLSGCALLSNISLDPAHLTNAAGYAMTAASLSDADIIALSQKTVHQLDSTNVVDAGTYQKRLANLMKGVSVEGLKLNFKVYKLQEINAFACGDGSIRVYSGLMDIMTDDELMAIIGHEIGHVVHQDTKNAMKKAYMAAAAREAIGSVSGTVGALSQSLVGDLAQAYVGSQFSQKQEYAADDYGFQFAVSTGHSPYSMYNALTKLVKLSQGSQASLVQKMFSSHPDSESRAEKMLVKAQTYKK